MFEVCDELTDISTEWLSPSVSPSECGLSNQLINTSIVQNEVLFSSDGLTLLSLDRLYSLKSALSSYSKTGSHLRLEDAVDELRRIILANNGEKVTKGDLLRSYDWLSVSNSALQDLDRMYRRAYGGREQFGGISGMPTIIEPVIRSQSEFEYDDDEEEEEFEIQIEDTMLELAIDAKEIKLSATPKPKGLALRLQTDFGMMPQITIDTKIEEKKDAEEEEDDDRTARPTNQSFMMQTWNTGSTIDQVLSPVGYSNLLSPDRSTGFGPMTPCDFGDLSPTTKGEWRFLMVDDAFKGAKTAAVETF